MKQIKALAKNTLAKTLSAILPPSIMRSKSFFHLWERKGYHVTPVQYAESIPDTREFTADLYEDESLLLGIDMHEEDQILLLKGFCDQFGKEYSKFGYGSSTNPNNFYFYNNAFETVDAEILYCMVRQFKPKNIIEIGSRYSTRAAAMAIRANIAQDSNYKCNLTCIEPYPKEWLSRIPEVSSIIQSKVEKLPLNTFSSLGENDILFIDSSHTVNVYNDVCFEYLEVLPSLNKGVFIHIHDIVLPLRYCEHWFNMKYFWNEQYLLQAFLAFNSSFKVRWAGNFMHMKYAKELAESLPSYLKFKNNSDAKLQQQGHKGFWIQRVK